jgi:hypothetical protein
VIDNPTVLRMLESLMPKDARDNLKIAKMLCSIFDKADAKMQSIMFQVVLGTTTGRGVSAESFFIDFVRNWPTEFKAACDAAAPGSFEAIKDAVEKHVPEDMPPCGHEECRDAEPNVLTVMRVPKDEKGN